MALEKASKPTFGWRDAILGGVVTLAMSIIAGVAIWIITKEPSQTEQLVYQINTPAQFLSGGNNVKFNSINIRNDGKIAANSVIITGILPQGSRISGRSMRFASGRATSVEDKSLPNELLLNVPIFYPGDSLSISFLTEGPSVQPIDYSVKSAKELARRETPGPNNARSGFSLVLMTIVVIIALITQWGLIQYLDFRRYRKFRSEFSFEKRSMGGYSPNLNNTGFLLMQAGLLDLAEEVLLKAVKNGTAEQMTYAHLATVKSLKGDDSMTEQLFSAADWKTGDLHTQGVVALDKFIVDLSKGNVNAALEHLKMAVKQTMGLKDYFASSSLLASLIEKNGLGEAVASEFAKLSPPQEPPAEQ